MKKLTDTTATRGSKRTSVPTDEIEADDEFYLTKAQLRELKRRLADVKDPVRYLIEGGFGPRFRLYYNVTDEVYVMNDPTGATLFKRRKAAVAVQKLLSGPKRIIRCTTRRKGQLVPILPKAKPSTKVTKSSAAARSVLRRLG